MVQESHLQRTVLRLRVSMKVNAEGYAEAESLLRMLGGTEATHGKVGVLLADSTELELDTTDIELVFDDLPEVLKAAVKHLQSAEQGERPEIAKRALYQLYRLVRESR